MPLKNIKEPVWIIFGVDHFWCVSSKNTKDQNIGRYTDGPEDPSEIGNFSDKIATEYLTFKKYR